MRGNVVRSRPNFLKEQQLYFARNTENEFCRQCLQDSSKRMEMVFRSACNHEQIELLQDG
jgi:hypothetical protein